jgi:hypothetical protein
VRARAHLDAERSLFTGPELADIEARYQSAHLQDAPLVRKSEGAQMLRELLQRYPRSNRAGCAVLELAQQSSGPTRQQYLEEAIARHDDAWFESGAQVGAVARAMLAVHLAGLERFDEAERVAAELTARFPGAVDRTGAPLDDTLESIRLLRTPAAGRRR